MCMEKNVNLSEEEVKKNRIKLCVKCAAATTCVAIGYVIGYKWSGVKLSAGIEAVCKTDPTLREHMASAIAETTKQRLLETN